MKVITLNNKVEFNIKDYISEAAFCPCDADEETKEKFLRSIGASLYDSNAKVNANLVANHILKHTNIIPLDNYNLAIYNGKYFEIKQQAAQLLEQNGILNIDWNALTADSAGAKTTEEFIAELEKTVPKYNSVVVLAHDNGTKQATADALPTIIQYFRDRGFVFENFYSIIK